MQSVVCSPRLGDLLVKRGALTDPQVKAILNRQSQRAVPFGVLAERLFGVDRHVVESCWAQQYSVLHFLPTLQGQSVDPEATASLHRRQAWQLRLLPLRFEEGMLLVATCSEALPRAATFCARVMKHAVVFKIVPEAELETALQEHYPWPAMRLAVRLRTDLLAAADQGRLR